MSIQPSTKFDNLVFIKNHVNVPPFILLKENNIQSLVKNYHTIKNELTLLFSKLKITSGTFLISQLNAVNQILQSVQLDTDAEKNSIRVLLQSFFGEHWEQALYVARSSHKNEDSMTHSFAGVYDSFLNLKTSQAIANAIVNVWLSSFKKAAILEHINNNALDAIFDMSVIVQKMVNAKYAGIAFTENPIKCDGHIVIEYTSGLGDGLVAGEKKAQRITISKQDKHLIQRENETATPFIDALYEDIMKLRALYNSELDIEWAWDGKKLWILQVRKITTIEANIDLIKTKTSSFKCTDLYGEKLKNFGTLPSFAQYFSSKRKKLHDFAKRNKLGMAGAWVIKSNLKGMKKCFTSKILGKVTTDSLILDFNDGIRQLILDKDEILAFICSLMSVKDQVYTFVVREYHVGEYGVITQVINNEVIAEISKDGLMAINRGVAHSEIYNLNSQSIEYLNNNEATQLKDNTLIAVDTFGHIQIEWVVSSRCLYPLDFSYVKSAVDYIANQDSVFISPGYALGTIIKISNTNEIKNMSIAPIVSVNDAAEHENMGDTFDDVIKQIQALASPPIIVIDKPYASLASLLPMVSGFVFKSASILCHLAILVREKNMPALASNHLYETLETGANFELDVNTVFTEHCD